MRPSLGHTVFEDSYSGHVGSDTGGDISEVLVVLVFVVAGIPLMGSASLADFDTEYVVKIGRAHV